MTHRFVAGAVLAFVLTCLAQSTSAPDLVILNARVFTGDAARPWAEAIRIQTNRIAAVGTTAEISASAGNARTIDAAAGCSSSSASGPRARLAPIKSRRRSPPAFRSPSAPTVR